MLSQGTQTWASSAEGASLGEASFSILVLLAGSADACRTRRSEVPRLQPITNGYDSAMSQPQQGGQIVESLDISS